MGEGIPWFAGGSRQADLPILDSKIYNNGVAMLRYQVL
jgi:hypothetical protein